MCGSIREESLTRGLMGRCDVLGARASYSAVHRSSDSRLIRTMRLLLRSDSPRERLHDNWHTLRLSRVIQSLRGPRYLLRA